MSELKPCPFCGGESSKIISYKSGRDLCWYIVCSECFVTTDNYETKELAIEAWNMRTSDDNSRKSREL